MKGDRLSSACTRYRPFLTLILGLTVWIVFIASLNALFRMQRSILEKRIASLRIGMTETEMIRILGKPSLMRRTSTFLPGSASMSKEGDMLECCYWRKSFIAYSFCGIYLNVNSKTIVWVSPYQDIIDIRGPWPLNLLFLSGAIIISFIWMLVRCFCTRKIRRLQR